MSAPDPPSCGFIAGQAEVVWLGGEDRLAFLDRLSTARVADLAPGTGRATLLLNDAGRVVDALACHAGAEGAALVTSGPGAAAVVAAQLRRYVLYHDRVRVTDAGNQVTVLRLLGPGAPLVAGQALGLDLAGLGPGDWLVQGEGAEAVWALRHPEPGGLGGFDLVLPAGEAAWSLAERLPALGAGALDADDYARLRVRAAWPAFGREIDPAGGSRANPLELGLRTLVDFGKGCYLGQEVVARLDSYDKVQRTLVRLALAGPAAPGDAVRAAEGPAAEPGDRPGRLTTVVPAAPPDHGWLALALLPRRWAATAFRVASQGGPVEARPWRPD